MSVRAWIWVSAAGLAIFVAVVATQGVFPVGSFDPGHQEISEYVHTSAGAAMVAGFVCWALSLMALARLIVAVVGRLGGADRWAYLQAGALLFAAIAILVLAVFPTDRGVEVPGVVTRTTFAGEVHNVASASATVGILAAALLGAVWRGGAIRVVSLALVATGVASSIVLLAVGDPLPGVRQRALVAAGCCWQAAWLFELRRKAASTSA